MNYFMAMMVCYEFTAIVAVGIWMFYVDNSQSMGLNHLSKQEYLN